MDGGGAIAGAPWRSTPSFPQVSRFEPGPPSSLVYMLPAYSTQEFNTARRTDKLPLYCYQCGQVFYIQKAIIKKEIRRARGYVKYCSQKCHMAANHPSLGRPVTCKHCGVIFTKSLSQIKKSPNHFCSHPCAALFNNARKTTGTRRSKLEAWIEVKLRGRYPDLEIHYNRKDSINSEIDVYIPSLKLAFELNGVYHYRPIHGVDKLTQTVNNDLLKTKTCSALGIRLHVIDTSGQIVFTEVSSEVYLKSIFEGIDIELRRVKPQPSR